MASVKIPAQKVILVGDFGVGKSSLFRRFMCDTFINSSDRRATLGEKENERAMLFFTLSLCKLFYIGLDHYSKTFRVNNRELNLQLFDTGGKIIHIRNFFCSNFLFRFRDGTNRFGDFQLLQVRRSCDSGLFCRQRSVIPQFKVRITYFRLLLTLILFF